MSHTQTLAFVGTANWDLYIDSDHPKTLTALPKPDLSVNASVFGDKHHIVKLMRCGYFDDTPTDAGLAFLQGLHTAFFFRDDGSRATYLSF